jgi:hypothetical protein
MCFFASAMARQPLGEQLAAAQLGWPSRSQQDSSPRASTQQHHLSRLISQPCLLLAAVTATPALKYGSFYEALSKDPQHKMIMAAVANDAATKTMLRLPLNVTAFVPADEVGSSTLR